MHTLPRIGDRGLFPRLRWPVYANHAAIGPLPEVARQAIVEVLDLQATEGVGAMPELFERLETVRARAAAIIGRQPAELAFVASTNAGVSAIANSIPWNRGDRVVLFRGEFPANTTPWQMVAAEEGLHITWLDLALLDTPDALAAELSRLAPRLVAVSAVQFRTGYVAPLALLTRLTHALGGEVFVDAIQGVGSCPLELDDVDYVAVGGQKWLMGPMGTAWVVASERAWAAMRPRMAGWLSHEQPLDFLFGPPDLMGADRPLRPGPPLLEGSTLNLAGLMGLGASLALHLEVGVEATWRHIQAWHDAVEPHLESLGFLSHRHPTARSGILSLQPPADVDLGALIAALAERGLSASSPDGAFRLSPSWSNSLEECSTVVEVVTEAVGVLRP